MSDLSGMYRSECANCKALRARVAELEADDGRMFTDQARWIALAMRMEADRDRWRAIADECHSWFSLILHRGYGTKHSASETDIKTMLSRIESARAANGEVKYE